MIEKFKNIPYWVYDMLSVVSGIITIATPILAVGDSFTQIKQLQDGTYEISFNKLLFITCVLLFFFMVTCIIKIRKYGNILRQVKSNFANDYYMFLHDFRNTYFEILKDYKVESMADKSRRIEELTKDTKNFLIDSLDYLCNLFEKNTGRKICASIKLIENTGEDTCIDKDTATVITFCRSKNSDNERKASDERSGSILIKDNSDFYEMLNENSQNRDAFYQPDLLQYDKYLKADNNSYRNTTPNYEKYYKGTIVVPIRIARKKLYYTSSNKDYDIIGFLCVDTLYTDAFRKNDFDRTNYLNIMKSFAAEMYIILNKYNYYLKKISKGEV